MKKLSHAVLVLILILVLALTGCGGGSGGGVTFLSAKQIGGPSETADYESTGLTLTFSADPTTLTADDITVTGATKGALSGTGTTRTLAISNITVANGETVSVAITSPITGSPQTAVVYKMTIAMDYLGGKLAYILQSDDSGYDANVPHGLIMATDNLTIIPPWSRENYKNTLVGTGEGYGTGPANTEKIVAQHVSGTGNYAAGMADEYEADGYTDWFLPSIDEWELIKENYTDLIERGVSFPALIGYWSSSEYSADKVYLAYFNPHSINTGWKNNTGSNGYVRPVRLF
jgi:hypothetical protein